MRRLLLLSVLVCSGATAQPPRGFFPWWDGPIVRDLNLSQSQLRQIRLTVREYRTRLIELRAEVNRAEQELQDAFDADPIDQKRAETAVEALAHARENLTRAFAQMSLRLRLQLTVQQWKELQRRKDESDVMQKRTRKWSDGGPAKSR